MSSTPENTSDEDDVRHILAANSPSSTSNSNQANKSRSLLLSNIFQPVKRHQQQQTRQEKLTGRPPGWLNCILDALCVALWRTCCVVSCIILFYTLLYFWPVDHNHQLEAKVAPARPRPQFAGPLTINNHLDELAERLFEEQFHAPESMAWTRDRRAFYTGVEGGFILLVEPYAERWSVAAKLNAPLSIQDKSRGIRFVGNHLEVAYDDQDQVQDSKDKTADAKIDLFVPFCQEDVELYGPRAEFEPSLVRLSRCSRPLGIRLSPDESRLYVMDPLSGFFRVDLVANLSEARASHRSLWAQNHVSKLIDFKRFNQSRAAEASQSESRIIFGDDIAVDWGAGSSSGDLIYMTDCSQRWTLRYLIWLMIENDDSGRLLTFDTNDKIIRPLGQVTPVKVQRQLLAGNGGNINGQDNNNNDTKITTTYEDHRGLSFPNGIEFTANKSSLLISDLNNRRILMHHLRGPLKGTTNQLMWVPGYPDNIRRGLDLADGTPTYWFACGCAVSDGKFELAEFMNDLPFMRVLLLKSLHLVGSALDYLGGALDSTALKDWALLIDSAWLKHDPYCWHGIVAQFTETGQVLRSLHGPQFSSRFKLISEAHQVALPKEETSNTNSSSQNDNSNSNLSALYLGSVYYSYLGRLKLANTN